ncbi:MAG: monovalent cation:proton antiporter-2 (CPA2) family protein [Pseudomonadota bacterium]
MSVLQQSIVFLGAGIVAVPIAKRLGFGSVLGYLIAGALIGPSLLGLIPEVEETLHFAEIGVVMLLFVIGLELQPSRLRVLRRSVFGLGSTQVLLTGVALSLVGHLFGLHWSAAVTIGFALALSSTAFVLQMLAEKKQLTSPHGRAGFGILLFQDLAVIPLIALVPLLAASPGEGAFDFVRIGETALILAVFVFGGRYLLRPILRLVASAQVHEIFTAAALGLVIGSALLMQFLGLSMGLGAFLAGVLVADSEYRHQLETDIEPFKGLLLGLFFLAVGMSANLSLLTSEPLTIAGITLGLVAIKALMIFPLGRLYGLDNKNSVTLSLLLAQGGEFAFVLFSIASNNGILDAALSERLILAVTISMALTPILYLFNERVLDNLFTQPEARPFDVVEDEDHDVVIAGFGRFGQIIARILSMRGIPFTALESSIAQVDFVRRFGSQIYYGDPARLDSLRAAHVDKAKVFVLAVDDVEQSIRIAELMRHYYPNVEILARARNRNHAFRLMDLGVKVQIRDTLRSSLFLAEEVLKELGIPEDEAHNAAETFRTHDEKTLDRQQAIHHDEEKLIQSAMESAQQLRELFESDDQARTVNKKN